MLCSTSMAFWASTDSQLFIRSALVVSRQCPKRSAASPSGKRPVAIHP